MCLSFVKLGDKKFWADIVLVIHIRNTLASVPHGKKADQIRWIAPVDRLKRVLPPNTPRKPKPMPDCASIFPSI